MENSFDGPYKCEWELFDKFNALNPSASEMPKLATNTTPLSLTTIRTKRHFSYNSDMFEKKYSLLAPYILDESVRKNMLSNEDLLRKYDSNHSMIKAYINEIDKRFDRETINKMIIETIFKFSSPVLISFNLE